MAAKQQVATIGEDFELTSIQALTLLLIDPSNPRPMKSLCSLFHCDASNITGIIDGLESKGLVSRQNDPNDRRIKVLCLEPAGKNTRHAVIDRLNGIDGPLFATLSAAEKKQLVTLIAKISDTTHVT